VKHQLSFGIKPDSLELIEHLYSLPYVQTMNRHKVKPSKMEHILVKQNSACHYTFLIITIQERFWVTF